MKTRVFILFVLVFLHGISGKKGIKPSKEKASVISVFIGDNSIYYGLYSDLLHAKQSGILSEYQFSIWVGAYGMIAGRKDADRMELMEGNPELGRAYEGISNAEMDVYRGSDWAFYNNHAYSGDWELGLWRLVE
jgi:hypothetical protein